MEAVGQAYTVSPELLKPLLTYRYKRISQEINKFLFENRGAEGEVFKTVERKAYTNKIRISTKPLKKVNYFLRFETGKIKIIFPESSRRVFAAGKDKTFYGAETVLVPLNGDKPRKIPSVVVHSKEFDYWNDWYKRVVYTVWMQDRPGGVYLAPFFDKVGDNLFTQPRFSGDFRNYPFKSKIDKAFCLRDITRAVLWLNNGGYCHGDVKMDNFLIREGIDFEGIRRPVSFLSDFDHTDRPGSEGKAFDSYPHWDPCQNHGILNLYTDLYGLAYTYVLEAFSFNNFALAGIRDRVFQDLRAGEDKESAEYCSFPCQSDQEIEIWSFFY